MNKKIIFHILALFTAMVWGSTFAVSKVLLNQGMSPAEIMTLRFIIAYLVMLPFSHKYLKSKSFKDEFLFIVCGIGGGSLYFLAENTAVEITKATSTIALLVCLTPLLTAFVNSIIHKDEKLSKRFLIGSIIALLGTALVVFNGIFVLDDNPIVILLSLLACVCWTIYSLVVRKLEPDYGSDVITRKVFFWGVLTMMIYFIFSPIKTTTEMLTNGKVLFCILFLALVASLGCYLMWNMILKRIGIVTASNYLYFNPIVALATANIVLNEKITIFAIIGCIFTIFGVYLCNTHKKVIEKYKK
ncbi:MAG: DMT family transporter [Bacteroidales bacterium]|nr:DMT family transporter [Bacteroidales bacterium]